VEFGSESFGVGIVDEFDRCEVQCSAVFQLEEDRVVQILAGIAQDAQGLIPCDGEDVVGKSGSLDSSLCCGLNPKFQALLFRQSYGAGRPPKNRDRWKRMPARNNDAAHDGALNMTGRIGSYPCLWVGAPLRIVGFDGESRRAPG
jgi:hypothetical protein